MDSETGLPQGVRIDKSGKVKPVVDLRKQCPIPWKVSEVKAIRLRCGMGTFADVRCST